MTGQRRALIIGGSLGGLFAAHLLRNDGWKVDVFERVAQPLAGRGAGIVTHAELFAALRRCGVPIEDGIGVEVQARFTLDASGRTIGEFPLRQTLTSWGKLYALLRDGFPDAHYHQDACLERIEQKRAGVTACFADGRRIEGDLLVGADGIRSSVRSQLASATVPLYAGYIAWRGLVDEAAVPATLHAQIFEKFAFCLPPGEQMLGYPVAGAENSTQRGHRRYNFVWYRPAAEETALADLLTDEQGHRHEVSIPPPLIRRDVVSRMREDAGRLLAPQFAELVKLTEQPFFQPIYDVESTQLVFGRVALLGDAAFVARPHVGMGVSKAAEDAVALADALRSEVAFDQALQLYQTQRLAFGAAVVARARHLGAYMQAQIKTASEREMAERYRTPAAVMSETATPHSMWQTS